MTTTVLFVHGTGARQAGVDRIVAQLESGLSQQPVDVAVRVCAWGETAGARLRHEGASIPSGLPAGGPMGDEVELWALLELDPLFELGLLAASASPGGEATASASTGRAAISRLPADPAVRAVLDRAGLCVGFADAIEEVMASEPARRAMARRPGDPQLRSALARAFVAMTLSKVDDADECLAPVHGDTRDLLVRLIEERLGDRARGRLGDMARTGGRIALELGATRALERRRRLLTRAVSPLAGDILTYLARGAEMRECVLRDLAKVDGPVVLVAHGLGAVICLGALCGGRAPNAVALVTVGSQAAYLYELDALPGLPFEAPLPETVPRPWVNIYDPRDLFSFAAAPVFGERVVADHEVDNRAPFPRAHSAYFDNPRVFELLTDAVRG